jgi:hypothetical protein
MQRFNTRNYSVRDFEEWNDKGELVLAPKFQRREVWSPKARSFLIDTILRGKPIPKLYMRQSINPTTRRTVREIVDGQQRLRTVLNFIKDGFKISKAHYPEYANRLYGQLPDSAQRGLLQYEFVVDLLQDMPDNEVYDVFARLNTYNEKLKDQELRNAKWFGDFKSCVYTLAKEFVVFVEKNKVFSAKSVLRMAEAEYISELLLAMQEGVREKKKSVIDKAYKDYDDNFPNRKQHERRFRETTDMVGQILGDDLPDLSFRQTRLLYPLFCALYHMQFGLPRLHAPRKTVRTTAYPKVKAALEEVDDLIRQADAATAEKEEPSLSAEERKFYDAYREHWVHAANRTTMTQYLCRQMAKTL